MAPALGGPPPKRPPPPVAATGQLERQVPDHVGQEDGREGATEVEADTGADTGQLTACQGGDRETQRTLRGDPDQAARERLGQVKEPLRVAHSVEWHAGDRRAKRGCSNSDHECEQQAEGGDYGNGGKEGPSVYERTRS